MKLLAIILFDIKRSRIILRLQQQPCEFESKTVPRGHKIFIVAQFIRTGHGSLIGNASGSTALNFKSIS